MKKRYLLPVVAALYLGFSSHSFGQLLQHTNVPISPAAHGFAGTFLLASSPHFHHEHDGEHCRTDALTNHWIETAGIAEQYYEEEQEQAIIAQNFEGGDRATYTVPIIFHVVYNPASPAENVSQSAIYALLDAVNEDFNALNADITDARTGLGFVPETSGMERRYGPR